MSTAENAYKSGPKDRVMLAMLARRSIANGRMSQQAFAELIGVSPSTVVKREHGTVGLSKIAEALYTVLSSLGGVGGMGPDIRAALESIPLDARSEGAALMALHALARKKGHGDMVEAVVGEAIVAPVQKEDEEAVEDDEMKVDRDFAGTMRLFENADRVMAKRSRRAPPISREKWDEARRIYASFMKQIEIAMESEASEKSKDDG